MNKHVLITGVTGFVGSHLVEHLQENYPDQKIYGLARWRSPLDNIKHLKDIEIFHGDLHDRTSLEHAIDRSYADHIYHLAAQSYVPYSYTSPVDTFNTNTIGVINLLEAVRSVGVDVPVIHICSTSEVYGNVHENEGPINELFAMKPINPYAISKASQDNIAQVYYKTYNIMKKIIITRAFTHSGPRRGSVFVDSSFARQIALIEANKQEPIIKVGNLNSVRTFCDVRDIVRGYASLVNSNKSEVYGEVFNIGGTETMTIREMLNKLIFMTYLSVEVKVDVNLLRPSDVTLQIPDTTKIKNVIGWEPKISYLKETLPSMLEFWRSNV